MPKQLLSSRESWADQLRAARQAAALSVAQLARLTETPRATIMRAESGTSDTGINTYAQLAEACGATLRLVTPSKPAPVGVEPPTRYPNPRNHNSWDNDAVQWLLEHDRVRTDGWTRGILIECLRRQPHRLRRHRERVREAAALAAMFGVEQHRIIDPAIGKTVIRLVRTDPDAPLYPYRDWNLERNTASARRAK